MKPRRAAKLGWMGALLGAVALVFAVPAEAQRSGRLRSFDPPQRGQVWRSAPTPTRYGRTDRRRRGTAGDVPLPPRRPAEFASPTPEPPQAPAAAQTPIPAPPAGDDAESCATVLAGGTVLAESVPAIHSGACGIEHPLMLKAIVLPDKRQITLEPPVAMRCRLAGAIAAWIIEDVAPAVAETGPALAALAGVGGYECRGRNGVAGAKLSQHASGNAMDIGALKLTDGRMISVQEQTHVPLFAKIRASACARFSTVLGPGADASHKTHAHVDLQERRHDYKMCQWDVAPASLPVANPATANQASPSPDKPADITEKRNEDHELPRTRSSAKRH